MLSSPTSAAVRLSESIRLPKRDREEVPPVRDVRPGEQHLGSRLLVVPPGFDRCHLRGLVVNDIFTVEVPEDELEWQEHRCEVQSHAQHDVRFCSEDAPQQVPGAGRRDAKRAGNVCRE